MKVFALPISLFVLLVSACTPDTIVHDEPFINEDCQEKLKSCIQTKYEEINSLWDNWLAGQLLISAEELDTQQLDITFKAFACDEIAKVCTNNSKPDLEKFYTKVSSTPEVDWEISDPVSEKLDPDKISQAIEAASSISRMRSFLVVRNGKLVVEEYFERENDPKPQQIKSITKSITSLLIGIAIEKQFIASESVEIKPYFPEYFSTHHDSRKEKITIEQLLTMRSGINFADTAKYSKYENTQSWDEPGAYRAYWRADNALDLALSYDMVESDDKEIILYSTPAVDLLSTVLERSTGMTTKEFADQNFFGHLGITNYTWAHDSAFHYIGGFTIFIRPRSLARVGQLLLQDGKFNNQQIVSKSWIDQSFTVAIPDFVTMETLPATFDYGYLWYLGKFKGFDVKFAWGWGGQFLVLIPEANTLIVTTAWPNPDGLTHWNKSQEIWNKIISNVIESL